MLLFGGGRVFGVGVGVGVEGGVIFAFVVAVAPAEEGGAVVVEGGLPEDGVGPGGGGGGALDEGLEALLEGVLVEGGGCRGGCRGLGPEGGEVGGDEGVHHGGVVVCPQVHCRQGGPIVRHSYI